MEETKEKRKCFIITPIGNENSDVYRKAKGVIESVIKPVLLESGFDDIKPAYEIMESGMINNQIITRIINDDLVIANLTGNNPNVMYELAIRHTVAKPIIHICENGTLLPFDIKDSRTIFYTDDMYGTHELKAGLIKFVKNLNYSKEFKDNPIYNAVQSEILFKKMDDNGRKTEAGILQRILDEISSLKTANDGRMENGYVQDLGCYEVHYQSRGTKETFGNFIKIISGKRNVRNIKIGNNDCYFGCLYFDCLDTQQIHEIIDEAVQKSGIIDFKIIREGKSDNDF